MQYDGVEYPFPGSFNSADCLRVKNILVGLYPVAQYQVVCNNFRELLHSHTIYQMTLAHRRCTCRLQVVSLAARGPLCGRVVKPVFLARCLRFQGRMSPHYRRCDRCGSVTKASPLKEAISSPLSPSYMIVTLAPLLYCHSHPALSLSLLCSHFIATLTQPFDCNTRQAILSLLPACQFNTTFSTTVYHHILSVIWSPFPACQLIASSPAV